MKNLIKKILGQNIRTVVFTFEPLDHERMKRALYEGRDTEAYKAVITYLRTKLAEAQTQMTAPELADSHGKIAHAAGGAEWLSWALGDLAEYANPETVNIQPDPKK